MSPLTYHGPGDRLDAHDLDSAAHSVAGLATAASVTAEAATRAAADTAISAGIGAPSIILPYGSSFGATAAPNTWFSANRAIASRFYVGVTTSVRYALFKVGVQSGNIEVGIVRLSGTNHLTYTRVVTSGLIACPAAANIRLDLGLTSLTPGDYAIWFLADNTTVTVHNGLDGNGLVGAARWCADGGAATQLAGSGTLASWGSRYMLGLCLEGDV